MIIAIKGNDKSGKTKIVDFISTALGFKKISLIDSLIDEINILFKENEIIDIIIKDYENIKKHLEFNFVLTNEINMLISKNYNSNLIRLIGKTISQYDFIMEIVSDTKYFDLKKYIDINKNKNIIIDDFFGINRNIYNDMKIFYVFNYENPNQIEMPNTINNYLSNVDKIFLTNGTDRSLEYLKSVILEYIYKISVSNYVDNNFVICHRKDFSKLEFKISDLGIDLNYMKSILQNKSFNIEIKDSKIQCKLVYKNLNASDVLYFYKLLRFNKSNSSCTVDKDRLYDLTINNPIHIMILNALILQISDKTIKFKNIPKYEMKLQKKALLAHPYTMDLNKEIEFLCIHMNKVKNIVKTFNLTKDDMLIEYIKNRLFNLYLFEGAITKINESLNR